MEEKEMSKENLQQVLQGGRPVSDYMAIRPGPVAGKTKVEGVRVDFNCGARVQVPAGEWRVRILDLGTAFVAFDGIVSDTVVSSLVKYYTPWRVEVWQGGKQLLAHEMDLRGQRVRMKFCTGALGDTLAWIPHVEEFRKKHGCEVWAAVSPVMGELLKESYPEIRFIGPVEEAGTFYATYYIGTFFPADNREYQPSSWKISGLQNAVAHILGLPEGPRRPFLPRDCPRIVEEPYVCIAAQSSAQMKYWNNPEGWMRTVEWLKGQGYRVLCIDKERCSGAGWHRNLIPWGAEDFTGDRPLRERLELIAHADFFVGLSSGLAWIAWGAGVPVVLISGFTLPHTEFPTPYRIINYHVCTGCWEDERYTFDHSDFEWCPRHKGDRDRQFECTRKIPPSQVIQACRRIMEEHGLRPAGPRT